MSLWPGVSGAGVVPVSQVGVGQQDAAVPRWFNPLDSALIDARITAGGFWAWRAQNSVGTPWPNGPADYAASLVSNEGNAVNLVEGNGAVPWALATGWGFVAAQLKYLLTGVTPTNDQAYAMLIQWSALNNALSTPAGARSGGGSRWFGVRTANNIQYLNGGNDSQAPAMPAGNAAVIGTAGYRNGVSEAGPLGAWTGTSVRDVYLGGLNNVGVAGDFITGQVLAVIFCDDPAAILPSLAAIAASPGGSMHNL